MAEVAEPGLRQIDDFYCFRAGEVGNFHGMLAPVGWLTDFSGNFSITVKAMPAKVRCGT